MQLKQQEAKEQREAQVQDSITNKDSKEYRNIYVKKKHKISDYLKNFFVLSRLFSILY
jgi:hypothetical protein